MFFFYKKIKGYIQSYEAKLYTEILDEVDNTDLVEDVFKQKGRLAIKEEKRNLD